MNLQLIRLRNETEEFLPSSTKNCETPIKRTHRKAEETLEFNLTKPRENFCFKPPNPIEGSWMIGLTSSEVYNFISITTGANNKFIIYAFAQLKNSGVSHEKVKKEIERDLEVSDIRANDLQDETIGQIIIKEYRKQESKGMKLDKHLIILAVYKSSIVQDFETFFKTDVDLMEDDKRLVFGE